MCYCTYEILQVVNIIDQKVIVVARGWEKRGDTDLLVTGYKVSVLQEKKSSGDGWW